MKADLHLHSTASDGVLSPLELVDRARQAGMNVIALTDHDTFGGFEQLGLTEGINLLRGVELNLKNMHSCHLLCYGGRNDTPLHRRVRMQAEKRIPRALAMMDLLAQHGLPLDQEKVIVGCGGTVGRPHLARAMVEAGYVTTVKEAFERYLGKDKPCYVPGDRLDMEEAVRLARESGFVPVLAHPFEMGVGSEAVRSLLGEWKKLGLMGVEVYHPSALKKTAGIRTLQHIASDLGLLMTGGSDFHAPSDGKHGEVGCMCGEWHTCDRDLDALMEAIGTLNHGE